jgi:hypothetical protein
MKRVLKPEHVERLSDTQIRITLPPCPDFDIEEDETVEVWIPPSILVKSEKPLYAGSFTIKADTYEQRIDHAIQGLKDEQTGLGSDARVATFLLTFFTCEIVAKSIIGRSKGEGTGRKSLPGNYSTNNVSDSLKKLKIKFGQESVGKLFSTEREVASEMSARKLRDEIVHRMKSTHRLAVRRRYASLMEAMMEFLSAVEAWRNLHRGSETKGGGTPKSPIIFATEKKKGSGEIS